MKKAFVTVVVSDASAVDVIEALRDARIGEVEVLEKGELSINYKDLGQVPNEVWLHEPDVTIKNHTRLRLVNKPGDRGGRWLTEDELSVLKQFGICSEVHVEYATGTAMPPYLVHKVALQAEVSYYGFDVTDTDVFKTEVDTTDSMVIENGAEHRWLCLRMPAWFNLTK